MLSPVKSWSVTCDLRSNRLDSPALFTLVCVLLSECHEWSVGRPSLLVCTVGRAVFFAVNDALVAINGSTHLNCFLAPIHQRRARGWTSGRYCLVFNKTSIVTRRESTNLVARAQPTVPLYRFRLDTKTQNKVLVQFHNYFVLVKVQWRSLVVNKFLKI